MSIERDTWYWISHPQEGDIFWPIYVNGDGQYFMDGKKLGLVESTQLEDLTWDKAVMPKLEYSYSSDDALKSWSNPDNMAKLRTTYTIDLNEAEAAALKKLLGSMNDKQLAEHGIEGDDRQRIGELWDLLPFIGD